MSRQVMTPAKFAAADRVRFGGRSAPVGRMTLVQFIDFLYAQGIDGERLDVVPCDCGDVNCHGWRLVEVEPAS
jgi:hypothetical protein